MQWHVTHIVLKNRSRAPSGHLLFPQPQPRAALEDSLAAGLVSVSPSGKRRWQPGKNHGATTRTRRTRCRTRLRVTDSSPTSGTSCARASRGIVANARFVQGKNSPIALATNHALCGAIHSSKRSQGDKETEQRKHPTVVNGLDSAPGCHLARTVWRLLFVFTGNKIPRLRVGLKFSCEIIN